LELPVVVEKEEENHHLRSAAAGIFNSLNTLRKNIRGLHHHHLEEDSQQLDYLRTKIILGVLSVVASQVRNFLLSSPLKSFNNSSALLVVTFFDFQS
jgi:hypothetical protein